MPADPKDNTASTATLPEVPLPPAELEVVVHPLVLLSVVDHYNRVAKDTKKRAVGVLLGSKSKGTVDITNSFAVPFEEDQRNHSIWYLDHDFLENMYSMFRKVAAKERIVGFYSTGPKIRENDLKIAALFKRFCADPLYVIVDVRLEAEGIPTTAYRTAEVIENESQEVTSTFKHVPSSVGAIEAEEVGVEHLLRDINDPSTSTLAAQVKHKMSALGGLKHKLVEVQEYLTGVLAGRLPLNNQIVYNLQDIFNLLPNLNAEELVRSMLVKTNDMHLVIYLSAITRSIVALHDLVLNKIKYKGLDDAGLPEDGGSTVTRTATPEAATDMKGTPTDSSSSSAKQ